MKKSNPRALGASYELIVFVVAEHSALIDEINLLAEKFQKDREILKNRLREKQSGTIFRVERNPDLKGGWPSCRITWGRGIHKTQANNIFTRRLHQCGSDGSYSKANLRASSKSVPDWELDLMLKYEKVLQKYRKQVASHTAAHAAISAISYPTRLSPAMAESLEIDH